MLIEIGIWGGKYLGRLSCFYYIFGIFGEGEREFVFVFEDFSRGIYREIFSFCLRVFRSMKKNSEIFE